MGTVIMLGSGDINHPQSLGFNQLGAATNNQF